MTICHKSRPYCPCWWVFAILHKLNYLAYLLIGSKGKQKQHGQQQHGGTRRSKESGFTLFMSSASPPQYATKRQNNWYNEAMNMPWVIASANKWARGTTIAQYVAIATTWNLCNKWEKMEEKKKHSFCYVINGIFVSISTELRYFPPTLVLAVFNVFWEKMSILTADRFMSDLSTLVCYHVWKGKKQNAKRQFGWGKSCLGLAVHWVNWLEDLVYGA